MDLEPIKVFLSKTVVDLGIKILAAIAFWSVGNEAIVRTSKEAGWPEPTPTQITRMVQG